MRLLLPRRCVYVAVLLMACPATLRAQQFLTDMMDTTTQVGKGLLTIYKNYSELRFGVYLQPQWQWAGSRGAPSFSGGDFATNVNNRFTMRRGRFRMDYVRLHPEGTPRLHMVFQFDASERGVFVRDAWGRFFENRWRLFSLTGGIFARPFGYELNLGSADRESPERGRMSQTLMRIERDAGFMLSLEPRGKRGPHWLRVDVGLFNGPGLVVAGASDYDSRKDVIGRIWRKPYALNRAKWTVSGGLSGFYGGIESRSPLVFREVSAHMLRDSASANGGAVLPRRYAGADVQLRIPNGKDRGSTELRAEYIRGQQTATITTSETPGAYPLASGTPQPLAVRSFDGAYFYFLQHLGSPKHQLVVKYDWYDPSRKVSGAAVDGTRGYTGADVRYNTLGVGYLFYANPNIKTTLWYDRVMNEHTAVSGFAEDVKDDVVTVRVQFRF